MVAHVPKEKKVEFDYEDDEDVVKQLRGLSQEVIEKCISKLYKYLYQNYLTDNYLRTWLHGRGEETEFPADLSWVCHDNCDLRIPHLLQLCCS